MQEPPSFASAHEIAAAVNIGKTSAATIVEQCLERISLHNPSVNAFTATFSARALARAAKVDATVGAGRTLPLAGVPFAVKNLFDVRGEVTLAGSKINQTNAAAAADAELINRLEQQGAVLVGALSMGEYAYDFTGENEHYGPCLNPWNPAHMTGGSSSGSGAALGAGFVPLTLGSDTNGSIRVPSSLCGTFGLKPTYGRLPRTGSFPFCDSLDHLGPMAHDTRDLALAYDHMQGYDPRDHACVERPFEPVGASLDTGSTQLRVGVAGGYFEAARFPDAAAAVATGARALQALGHDTPTLDWPMAMAGRAAAFLITNIEGATLHRERLRTRAREFDGDTRDRFLAGTLLPAAWYTRAQLVRRAYAEAVYAFFKEVDVILAPATPYRAPGIGQKTMQLEGKEVGVRANLGYFTQPVSCIGLPVICAPIKTSQDDPDNLPIGIQIIAAPWREIDCFQVAAALERAGVAHSLVAPSFR